MATGVSFSGISTGLNTDALISAVIESESQGLYRLQKTQSRNTQKSSVLQQIKTAVSSLGISMNTLNNTKVYNQTVSNSDTDGKYASVTAYDAVPGSYTLQVDSLATRAKHQVSFADQDTTPVGKGTYAVLDTEGTTKTFTIDDTNNTLAGFQAALNKAGANVSAAVIDTGTTGSPSRYQMVLSATDTGAGKNGSTTFTVAKIDGADTSALGFASGTLDASGNLASGGTASATAATNNSFYLNGVHLTRSSNVVTDAVQGLTLTLKSGGQTEASTLTVTTDKSGLTSAVNDVISSYNNLLKIFKNNSAYAQATTDASGNTSLGDAGVLANDSSVRSLISQARDTIMGSVEGLASNATYRSAAEVGLKTGRDGTLSLDSTAFGAALDKDPKGVAAVFAGAGKAMETLVNRVTAAGDGSISSFVSQIKSQNDSLQLQINSQQSRLARRKVQLQTLYANLESQVGSLQSAGQSLSSL